MNITYDPEGDVLEIVLRDVRPANSDEVAPDVTVLRDDEGDAVSIEILNASKRIEGEPTSMSFKILLDQSAAASA